MTTPSGRHSLARGVIHLLLTVGIQAAMADTLALPASPTALGTKTPVRMDPKHPLRIGEEYYSDYSKRHDESGVCIINIMVDATGMIRALQLIASSGFPHLDASCVESASGGRMIPATLNGKPVLTWVAIPVTWKLGGGTEPMPRPKPDPLVPRMAADYELQVGPKFYPATSRERREEGDSVVFVHVDRSGTVVDTKLAKSTGSATLDRASLDAAILAQFAPAKKDDQATDGWTIISMFWRLK
jgi:TonB family protein